MRFFACLMSLTLLLFPPAPRSPGTLPIPADMHETWPGAKLTDADKQLLKKAVGPELSDEDKDSRSAKKYSVDSLDTADMALGTLGQGVMILMSGSSLCGTGGCPIYVYLSEKQGYRKVLGDKTSGPGGWAFAVVRSKPQFPIS